MKNFKYISGSAEALVAVRDAKIHISSLMLLSIVDRCTKQQNSLAYIGEITAWYNETNKNQKSKSSYSYAGITSMLRKMREKGLVRDTRNGRYVGYRLTKSGINVLDSLSI